MKTELFSKDVCRYILCALCTFFVFSDCKKDDTFYSRINSQSSDLIVSDGIVTVQASIFPPATPQSFIANNATSIAEFQITSSQHVYLDGGGFDASYPLLQYIVVDFPWINNNGSCTGNVYGDVYPNSGFTLRTEAHYLPVDSNTSGSVVKLAFRSLTYRTDDETYYTLYANNPVEAQEMCLVNNIPHIDFQDPGNAVISNGYTEIADVKLTGDTAWTLNTLPLFLSSFSGEIPKSKLIIRSQGVKLETTSQAIELNYGLTDQTVINFTSGFHHLAHKVEILKIFAKVQSSVGSRLIRTRLYPLNALKWTDGLGVLIPGTKNLKFFKNDTGMAEFYH